MRAEQQLAKLQEQSLELEGWKGKLDKESIKISLWSCKDHFEHLMICNENVLSALETHLQDEPKEGKPLNFIGKVILKLGFLPRGVGKAPDFIRPKGKSKEELDQMFHRYQERLCRLRKRAGEVETSIYSFPHYAFGNLTPLEWLRVIEVHNHHHIKIMRDIEKEAKC